jgi:hypothetical protein
MIESDSRGPLTAMTGSRMIFAGCLLMVFWTTIVFAGPFLEHPNELDEWAQATLDRRLELAGPAAWCDLLKLYEVPRDGVIVELRSGRDTGLAKMLARYGFCGILVVRQTDQAALADGLPLYRRILPQATVIAVSRHDTREIPDQADAVLAAGNQAILEADEFREAWSRFLAEFEPRLALIGPASSLGEPDSTITQGEGDIPDELRPPGLSPEIARLGDQILQRRGHCPAQWLISSRRGHDEATLGRNLPGAVRRLGESTFVTMEAFPVASTGAEILFVRRDLLELFLGKTLSEKEAHEFVRRYLLLTLDPKRAEPDSQPVVVHVDRQADPMNMSLTGNQGSGRAAYVGDRFNLKGLGKTVLATSKDPIHSDGILNLVGALWEMLCSNALQINCRTGTAPVLAVADLKKLRHIPWLKEPVPSGMIIRLDNHGELDRPTHLFYGNKPVSAQQFRHFARRLGMQDAEKFIERILHGGWSAGNISLDAHLIDYDTVFLLRGRAPQWSYRPNWLSDFFGLEGQGQKMLLEAMASHSINVDRISSGSLAAEFDTARQAQLEERFLDLIGIGQKEFSTHLSHLAPIVVTLAPEFERLALKTYPNFGASAPWDEENHRLSVYDFSRFFRFYPIARAAGPLDRAARLALIRKPARRAEIQPGARRRRDAA